MTSHDNMVSLEATAVPADHQNPNHPHYPRDLEHRASTRRFFLSNKRFLIAGSIITIILVIAAGVVWGVALSQKDNNKGAKDPITTTAEKTSSLVIPDVDTVYETPTTFAYFTSRVPLLIATSLATSTIILTPTARAQFKPETSFRSTLTEGGFRCDFGSTCAFTSIVRGYVVQEVLTRWSLGTEGAVRKALWGMGVL